MHRKRAIIFWTLFGLLEILSFWGLVQLSKKGGPCNAGIELVMLAPVIFFLSIIQLAILNYVFNFPPRNNVGNGIVSIICTLAWIFCMATFLNSINDVFYLIPFFVFNCFATFITFKHKSSF